MRYKLLLLIIGVIGISEGLVNGAGNVTVAVLELNARDVGISEAVEVTGFIREGLAGTDKFKVLEQQEMNRISREQKFKLSGCTSQECAVRIGKLLKVRQMVYGSLSKLGGRYYISVRLIDVRDGSILMAEVRECFSGSELKKTAESIGLKFTGLQVPALAGEEPPDSYDGSRLKKVRDILYAHRSYYKKETRNSWIMTGFGLFLGAGGFAWFRGEDRIVFGVLSGGLTAVGALSLKKNYARIREINRDINITLVRVNLK